MKKRRNGRGRRWRPWELGKAGQPNVKKKMGRLGAEEDGWEEEESGLEVHSQEQKTTPFRAVFSFYTKRDSFLEFPEERLKNKYLAAFFRGGFCNSFLKL